MDTNPFVLFAEDDANEAELLRLACRHAGFDSSRYHIVRDGLQALAYLESAEFRRKAVPLPTHVITDLEMPVFNGFKLLCWIRGHPEFKALPVTVVTNIHNPEVKKQVLLAGGRFVSKPAKFAELVSFISDTVRPQSQH